MDSAWPKPSPAMVGGDMQKSALNWMSEEEKRCEGEKGHGTALIQPHGALGYGSEGGVAVVK